MTEAAFNLYDEAYEEGYNAALKAIREANRVQRIEREEKYRKAKAERTERFSYFAKQRIVGVTLTIASVVALVCTGGDFAAAVVTIPLGLLISFTRLRLFN